MTDFQEWAVRFSPDGMNHIQPTEDAARELAEECGGVLLRRSGTTHQPWQEVGRSCPECDGYGVLDGLEPCPAKCPESFRALALRSDE